MIILQAAGFDTAQDSRWRRDKDPRQCTMDQVEHREGKAMLFEPLRSRASNFKTARSAPRRLGGFTVLLPLRPPDAVRFR